MTGGKIQDSHGSGTLSDGARTGGVGRGHNPDVSDSDASTPTRLGPIALLLIGVVVVIALVVLVWLPWNPLEGDAGPLDEMLPEDVDVAVRFEPRELALSPLADSLWRQEATQRARSAVDLEARVLGPLRAAEERLAAATLGLTDAPTAQRDVFGREVVIALRGDDVLLLSRITDRARALELLRRLGGEELRQLGLYLDGDLAVFSREGLPSVYLARFRDVLIISTDRNMVTGALARGAESVARTGPAGPAPFAEALQTGRRPGQRMLFWMDPARVSARFGFGDDDAPDPDGETALDLWLSLFPPDMLGAAAGELDFTDRERLSIALRGEYGAAMPERVTRLPNGIPGSAALLRADAARFARPSETVAVSGLAVRASDAVRTLVESQPPSRRELIDQILAEDGHTIESVSDLLAGHLEDGVGAVVARLDETDALDLETPDGGVVQPIPATLVLFRLRDPADSDSLLIDLADEAESLFGAALNLEPQRLADGARLYGLDDAGFGLEWQLLQPAFALVDGLFVFSTNHAYLERALHYRRDHPADRTGADTEPTLDLLLRGDPLRKYVEDQRWDFASQATYRDWRAERHAIRKELDDGESPMTPDDRQHYEDVRIEERMARVAAEDWPAAIQSYSEIWRPLDVLGDVELTATLEGRAFRIDVQIDIRR